jgi:hypothetical protein
MKPTCVYAPGDLILTQDRDGLSSLYRVDDDGVPQPRWTESPKQPTSGAIDVWCSYEKKAFPAEEFVFVKELERMVHRASQAPWMHTVRGDLLTVREAEVAVKAT